MTILEPGDRVSWTTEHIQAVVVQTWPSQVYPEHQIVVIRTLAPTRVAVVLSRELHKIAEGSDVTHLHPMLRAHLAALRSRALRDVELIELHVVLSEWPLSAVHHVTTEELRRALGAAFDRGVGLAHHFHKASPWHSGNFER
jgi:hypothetical protein